MSDACEGAESGEDVRPEGDGARRGASSPRGRPAAASGTGERLSRIWRAHRLRRWNESVRVGERELPALMELLATMFPTELDGFFHRLDDGTRCPFYLMDARDHGRPRFPVEIEDAGPEAVAPERGEQSLVEQRAAEGARLYNGRLYRLVEATADRWALARADYFTSLESCDYLRYHLLREWGEALRLSGGAARRRRLADSAVLPEWLERVRAVRAGDFSGYCAGMGLTMPVFAIEEGCLVLLLARGSARKATGAGKYHCCPAGMFEFHPHTLSDRLTFEDLRTYLTKELIEETMAGGDAFEEAMHARLEGGAFGLQGLEAEFERLSAAWRGEGRDTRLFDAVRALSPESARPWFVVDAFRLRPEIVVPFYLDRAVRLSTNWETVGDREALRRFESSADLTRQLSGEIALWTEPGLAAAVLGGRRWFSRRAAGADGDPGAGADD